MKMCDVLGFGFAALVIIFTAAIPFLVYYEHDWAAAVFILLVPALAIVSALSLFISFWGN